MQARISHNRNLTLKLLYAPDVSASVGGPRGLPSLAAVRVFPTIVAHTQIFRSGSSLVKEGGSRNTWLLEFRRRFMAWYALQWPFQMINNPSEDSLEGRNS